MTPPAPGVRARVLVVEDSSDQLALIEARLAGEGYAVTCCTSGEAALGAMREAEFDAVVTDLGMPGMSGVELCQRIADNRPDVPVLVVTAHGRLEAAVASLRAGAYDFLTKPVQVSELLLALDRAVQHRRLRVEVQRLQRVVAAGQQFDELIGESEAMKRVYDVLERVADLESTVLLTGPSGTGKEVAARVLHARGRRRAGPFVAINCAAIPETLLESELFGHARGAFTDAKAARAGLFVRANGGTLFLDEVGDMPLALQPRLLRALQDRVVRPLGSNDEVPFDARIVAATNRDLETLVEAGRFREDLYFRLSVIPLEMPPLCVRGDDVLLLAQRFVERYAAKANKRVLGLAPAAAAKLRAYSWPGNVRELNNCIERAVALTRFELVAVEDLPDKIAKYQSEQLVVVADDPAEILPLEELEKRYILRALATLGGSRTVAARALGVDRKTLYRKLVKYGAVAATAEEE